MRGYGRCGSCNRHTRGTHKETARCQPCTGDSRWNFNERRFVAAVGFTEWRVNAFQMYAAHLFVCKPSKAASSRFLAAEGGGEGWCGGRGTVFRRVGRRNSRKRKFLLRPNVCTICRLVFFVCRVCTVRRNCIERKLRNRRIGPVPWNFERTVGLF